MRRITYTAVTLTILAVATAYLVAGILLGSAAYMPGSSIRYGHPASVRSAEHQDKRRRPRHSSHRGLRLLHLVVLRRGEGATHLGEQCIARRVAESRVRFI